MLGWLKRAWPWLTGLVAAAGLGWAFLGAAEPLVCRVVQDGHRFHTGQLLPPLTVGQTLVSPLPRLAKIEVKLASFSQLWPRGLRLTLVEVDQARTAAAARSLGESDEGVVFPLRPSQQVGQTFTPDLEPLRGLWVWIDKRRLRPPAAVRLRLYEAGVVDLPGPLLAEARLAYGKLPRAGLAFFPLGDLAGQSGSLLFTLDVQDGPTGAGAGDLLLRFRSARQELFYGRPAEHPYRGGRTWRPGAPYGGWAWGFIAGSDKYAPWEFWEGNLVFWPAYAPRLPQGPALRRAVRPGRAISDNVFNAFAFEPVPDSRGKSYYFYLQAEAGQGAAPAALADWADRYPQGRLAVGHVPTEGALAFRAWHAVSRGEAQSLFLQRATRNKPGPWGRPAVLVGLALAHLALTGLAVALLLRRGRGR